MEELGLRTLGGVQITLGNRSLVGQLSAKAQALLCYLVVTGRSHSRLALAGLLWSDKSEAAALTNLRQALRSLRHALGSHLLITRHDVAFDRGSPYWLDTEAFAARFREGMDDLQMLREAMEIYRGDFLAGFYVPGAPAFDEWVVMERERLRTLALDALHTLAVRYAHAGEYATALRYATRLLAMVPWREEAHRLKMLLLARSGRYAEALVQYERCRRVLAAELGVEPAVETTALYERIRMARRMRRHNLPPQPTPFVGRERELAEIDRLLGDPTCRLLTLVGPGGIGKTRLAIRVAERVEHRFLHGVRFVPLASVPEAELLAATIAEGLGLVLHGHDPQEQVLDYLREKEMLLVLDGFEHLMEGARFLGEVLGRAADVKLLVTSRERLGLRWESLFVVEGMDVPPERDAFDPAAHDAVRLFLQLARRVHPGFAPERELASVVRICRLVEGMPLGIELAAAWSGRRGCADIARDLERGADLATPLQDVPQRHRSLRAAFEHSWRLLSDEEQRVFGRLSVFRGGFTQRAAVQVAGASVAVLTALVTKSLLRREVSDRYTMHELLRQYAAEKLARYPDEERATRERHCAYYASFLAERESLLQEARQREALHEIEGEIENVRQSWKWAVKEGDVGAILAAMGALSLFYSITSRAQEGAKAFESAVATLRRIAGGDRRALVALGRALVYRGMLVQGVGDYSLSEELLEEGLSMSRRLGDRVGEALALNNLGIVAGVCGEYDRARELFRQSLDLSRVMGELHRQAVVLNNLGILERMVGEHELARRLSLESLEMYRRIGHRRGVALALQNLGLVAYYRGDFTEARRLYHESMGIFREIGDRWGVAIALANIGEAAREQGEYQEAVGALQEALGIHREIGHRSGMVSVLGALGGVARLMGERTEARRYLRETLRIAVEGGYMPMAMDALVELASLLAEEGKRARALELLALVLGHPATERRTAERGHELADRLASELSPAVAAVARERGRRRLPEEVAAEEEW